MVLLGKELMRSKYNNRCVGLRAELCDGINKITSVLGGGTDDVVEVVYLDGPVGLITFKEFNNLVGS